MQRMHMQIPETRPRRVGRRWNRDGSKRSTATEFSHHICSEPDGSGRWCDKNTGLRVCNFIHEITEDSVGPHQGSETQWLRIGRMRTRSTLKSFFRPLGNREVLRSSKEGRSSFRRTTRAMTFYTSNQEMPSYPSSTRKARKPF